MQQWSGHLSTVEIARQFGMVESLEVLITARRLRWLDQGEEGAEETAVWMVTQQPAYGAIMRWRDIVRKDLKKFRVNERCWYSEEPERGSWWL